MSLVVNHNMMSANTARILNQHYSRLNTSTQRLSSGLRINTAADDAAGLAIRELQRADIASLKQGARNANDAISLIQTADGALQVIDEKLIRMKELAEQAATGTYDSTQRLMIDSEYQAMASEITRIAKATDFNGIHLLNGNLASSVHDGSGMKSEGKMKVHFGTGNDCAEDYYYIQIGETTSEAFSLGSNSTWDNAVDRFIASLSANLKSSLKDKIGDGTDGSGTISQTDYINLLGTLGALGDQLRGAGNVDDGDVLNDRISAMTLDATYKIPADFDHLTDDDKQKLSYYFGRDLMNTLATGGETLLGTWNMYASDRAKAADGVQNKVAELADGGAIPDGTIQNIINAAARTAARDFIDIHDYDGMNIATQENAQIALDAINKAIVEKDKIRANLGSLQNRLENTISNLNIQAENLQAAESRISDVDVSTEMTEFVRNQILTQSAVAMLAQANSLPKMAMQLISG